MKSYTLMMAVPAIVIAAVLSGCDRNQARQAVKEAVGAAANAENAPNEKLNAYIEGNNRLVGNFGLAEMRKSYFEKNIPARSAKDDIFISAGRISQAIDPLKKGRAVKSDGMPELDQSADQLIGALEKLISQLNEMEPYYKAKAYKEDDLAKGKAQDPLLRESLDAAMSAQDKFGAALDVQSRKRDDALLATLKADGNATLYHLKLGLRQAEDVVNLFKSEADISNLEKYKQADALVAELEKTLAEQRKLHAALERGANQVNHDAVTERLTELVGAYRQLKTSKRSNDFNSMIHRYNGAVNASNEIRFPGA
jgi:hypothetical protein